MVGREPYRPAESAGGFRLTTFLAVGAAERD